MDSCFEEKVALHQRAEHRSKKLYASLKLAYKEKSKNPHQN